MDQHAPFLKRLLEHEHDLRAFIGSLVLDRHLREDLFQEVALALWEQRERFDPTRSFGAWARGVATHKILQRRERDDRFPTLFPPETIHAIAAAFERTEAEASPRREALDDCLDELPQHARQLLVERYAENRRAPEIAAALGRSVDAIYQALSRVRLLLEDCIRRRLAAA